ncbi:hypothetical protein B0H19DRAFT_1326960 [Mycena capillaripes]|nr:hypothetical protein B0H19DRAFT_1326960 [Mycena capillaripes]
MDDGCEQAASRSTSRDGGYWRGVQQNTTKRLDPEPASPALQGDPYLAGSVVHEDDNELCRESTSGEHNVASAGGRTSFWVHEKDPHVSRDTSTKTRRQVDGFTCHNISQTVRDFEKNDRQRMRFAYDVKSPYCNTKNAEKDETLSTAMLQMERRNSKSRREGCENRRLRARIANGTSESMRGTISRPMARERHDESAPVNSRADSADSQTEEDANEMACQREENILANSACEIRQAPFDQQSAKALGDE